MLQFQSASNIITINIYYVIISKIIRMYGFNCETLQTFVLKLVILCLVYLDSGKNCFGDYFIKFLKEVKFCVANGRITPEFDGFISLSKGKAVVDYIEIPQDCIQMCNKCEVHLISDVINDHNLVRFLSTTCKQLDHLGQFKINISKEKD